MKIEHKVIAISALFGVIAWMIDAGLDYYVFYKGTLTGLLIVDIPIHKIFIRFSIVGCFLVFGILMSRILAARKRVEEKIRHLNAVQRAIQHINKLSTKERDRNKLIQNVCDILVQTRECHNAWIALINGGRRFVAFAEANLSKSFTPLLEQLKHGEVPLCRQMIYLKSGIPLTDTTSLQCSGCPLLDNDPSRGMMTTRLEYAGRVYGCLCVSIPGSLTREKEEQALFAEAAGDIASALQNLEQEEHGERAEEKLKGRSEQLEEMAEKHIREPQDARAELIIDTNSYNNG